MSTSTNPTIPPFVVERIRAVIEAARLALDARDGYEETGTVSARSRWEDAADELENEIARLAGAVEDKP